MGRGPPRIFQGGLTIKAVVALGFSIVLGVWLVGSRPLLSISPATVDTHRTHILQKLDVHNTAELVLYAVRHGVVS